MVLPPPRRPRVLPRALVALTLATLACATPEPDGPLFQRLPAPETGEALLYLYRDDENATRSELRLRLDGTELETLRNGEFAAVHLTPGNHQLDVSLRAARFLPTAWTSTRFCVDEKGTAFVRVWARLTAQETVESRQRDVAAPGWSNERANLVVLVANESEPNALPRLETRRKAAWSPAEVERRGAAGGAPFGSRCGGRQAR